MKKILKPILFGMLACCMFFNTGISVMAAEKCNVSFMVKDETESNYSGTIKVIMKDVNSDKKFEYDLTRGNSWGGKNIPKYTVDGNTVYSVSFEGIKNGFKLINQDGSEITEFDAYKDIELKWKIISIASENITVEENSETGNSNVTIDDNIQTGNADADKLFNEFMNTVAFIEHDEKWANFLNSYELFADSSSISDSDEYAKATGRPKQEYLDMSLFDRFVYFETYVRMAQYLSFGDWDRYYSSEENFNRNVIGPTVQHMKLTEGKTTVVADAYLKLMDWQYKYIDEHKTPYNFVTGKNFNESKPATGSGINTEKVETEEPQEEVKEDNIWDSVGKLVADNAVGILVALSLAGVVVGVSIYKKKTNMD